MPRVVLEHLPIFTDARRPVVVKIFPEKLEHPGLANALLIENADDFPLHIVAGLELSLSQRRPQMIVFGAQIGESPIDRQEQLLILEHHPPVLVGLATLTKLRTKEGVAIQKDRHQPQENPVLFPQILDRFLKNSQVNRRLRLGRRTKRQGLKQKINHPTQPLVAHPRRGHQISQGRDRANRFLLIKNQIEIPILPGNRFDIVGKLMRPSHRTVGHETEDFFRNPRYLRRLRAVHGIEKGIIAQPMIPDHRQARLKPTHPDTVSIIKRTQVLIQTEIHFDLALEV